MDHYPVLIPIYLILHLRLPSTNFINSIATIKHNDNKILFNNPVGHPSCASSSNGALGSACGKFYSDK